MALVQTYISYLGVVQIYIHTSCCSLTCHTHSKKKRSSDIHDKNS